MMSEDLSSVSEEQKWSTERKTGAESRITIESAIGGSTESVNNTSPSERELQPQNQLMKLDSQEARRKHIGERQTKTRKRVNRRAVGQIAALPHKAKSTPDYSQSIKPSDGKRVVLDPENVEKGLAQLVLTVIELLRQLMEKQAVHRMDADDLTEAQIEKMGRTFMKLEEKVVELRDHFGLQADDLNINLGPLGNLM